MTIINKILKKNNWTVFFCWKNNGAWYERTPKSSLLKTKTKSNCETSSTNSPPRSRRRLAPTTPLQPRPWHPLLQLGTTISTRHWLRSPHAFVGAENGSCPLTIGVLSSRKHNFWSRRQSGCSCDVASEDKGWLFSLFSRSALAPSKLLVESFTTGDDNSNSGFFCGGLNRCDNADYRHSPFLDISVTVMWSR